ncbi:hypothetical protein BGV04_19960 [Clostridioides difficile]|nr:hypothetical protein BGV04_19960 [Clostridioides difficile]
MRKRPIRRHGRPAPGDPRGSPPAATGVGRGVPACVTGGPGRRARASGRGRTGAPGKVGAPVAGG